MEFENVIRTRCATRKFDKKVEKDKLDKILEAGRLAPTAKNKQPFKVLVVESPEGLSFIDEASPCRYNAKTVLVVCGDKDNSYQKNDMPIYVMDASIVATHMMLEAANLGVDSIWIEMFDGAIISSKFNLPSSLVPVCLLPIGYRSDDCPESPLHNTRKNIEVLVEYR